ncbi:uncharacterized protein ctnnd1 isoform X1 [Labrus mixtus]|uniref:uncharacterized protein ctnnd1 isoform X1 n=1 Tax=Labrus mixtus TaxID=508554 RepID=UPI0029BFF636|nr:uncharacterized protein ctnnd1 isoform X1 [Labrus mixtus]
MQRFMWPGYKMQLLAELQKQQNNTQFCDTLLQTEGISIPAHSCILAALSPYLSRKLSASTSLSGEKHQLQLQALKAQTLLKLVGLLYSGELEVKGSVEKNDVLSAARQLGITDLVEGQNWQMKEREPQKKGSLCSRDKEERTESLKMQDAQQVQLDFAVARTADSPPEERSCVSIGTQTIATGEKAVSSSFTHSSQTKASTQEPASSLPQYSTLLTQNFCSSSCPTIPFMLSEASSDGASTLDPSSDSVTNPTSTSASSKNVMALPFLLDEDSSSSATPQEHIAYQQSSEGTTNGKMADGCENTEEMNLHIHREDPRRGGTCTSKEKRQDHAHLGMRSLAKMKQMHKMMEATQISIKVKLRRRTEEQVWEVVNRQDSDETLAALASLQQDGSNHKRPQTDLTNDAPPSTSVQPDSISKPKSPPPQLATSNSTDPQPPHSDTTSNSQIQNGGLDPVPLPQPSGQVEDSDEQIEKLLEDIMMGLNILPSLERDPKKSHLLQPSNERAPATCQIRPAENDAVTGQMHAGVGAAVCECCQDLGTQIGLSSTESGIHCCFILQNQPSCSSLSSVQSDVVPARQQQLCSPQNSYSVTSMSERPRPSHQDMSLSKSPNPSNEVPTAVVIPVALYCTGQIIHYPEVNLHKSSQEDQNSLEILPRTDVPDAPSSLSVSLPCMKDFQLPPCLSPLESPSSAAKHPYNFSNPTSHSDKIQLQPCLHRPPWLTEDPGSLQYPLIAITHNRSTSGSSPREKNNGCWEKCQQGDLTPQTGGTCAESGQVNERRTISADQHNVEEGKSPPKKMKTDEKCKQSEADTAAPGRRKRSRLQDAAGSLSHKEVNDGDATQSQFNISVCSVRLSSNNVLAKKREQATSSSNMPDTPAATQNEPSNITENLTEKTREPRGGIRTRSFLKKAQETANNTSPQHSSVLKTIDHEATIGNKQGESCPKRKRGRPPKVRRQKSPEISHTINEQKDDSAKNEPNSSLSKEEEGKTAERKCEKRRRNRSRVGVVPLKKTSGAESTTEKDLNNNEDPAVRKPKQPCMVTLKEFQKLFRQRHLKTRMSEENWDEKINKTARKEENDEDSFPRSGCEESTKETEIDLIQPDDTEGIGESHSIFDVTVDKKQNHILNNKDSESQKEETHKSTGEEARSFGEEQHSVFSSDVWGGDVEELAVESEQPLRSQHEAPTCDGAVSTQRTINNGASHNDSNLAQDIMPLDHIINPQTPKRTGLPLMDADGCKKSSGCDQKEVNEEEEEEVEVDVLLCSPDKAPQTRHCENGQENVDIIPEEEEEEEEDVNEIDVTGDEAE